MTPFDCRDCASNGKRRILGHQPEGLGGAVVTDFEEECPFCGGSGIDPELRRRLSEIIEDVRAEDGRTRGREMPPSNDYWAAIFEAAVVAYWKEKE